MNEPTRRKGASSASEAARLRESIDSGKTHDKVDYPDPAAAPLGTDEEAGGARASEGLVHDERVHETAEPEGLGPDHLPERGEQRGSVFLVAFGMVIALVLVLIGLGLVLR